MRRLWLTLSMRLPLRALTQATWPRLDKLEFPVGSIGAAAIVALAKAGRVHFPVLGRLWLEHVDLGDEGMKELARMALATAWPGCGIGMRCR